MFKWICLRLDVMLDVSIGYIIKVLKVINFQDAQSEFENKSNQNFTRKSNK